MSELLFEVGFYRVSPEAWTEEEDRIAERHLAFYRKQWLDLRGTEPPDEAVDRYMAPIRRGLGLGRSYNYNEIVGWVRLDWDGPGPVVKGDAWRIDKKRIRRESARWPFDCIPKVIEIWFRDETSDQIVSAMRDELVSLRKRGKVFAGRHPDLDAFDTIAPLVDWRAHLGLDH